MFQKKFLLIFLICSLLLLTACTSKDNNKKENKDLKKTDSTAEVQLKSPELPKTIEEVINYPVGPFGTDEHKEIDEAVKKELDKIPTLPKDAGEQELNELFAYLYSLFKMEYQDPREALSAYDITEKGNTETNTSNQQGSFNVEIILDSSGSMGNKMGGKTRMELAKESIQKFASSLPKEANVSLRVYGHKGTGSDKDKTMSCASNELVYSPQPYDKAKMDEA